MSSNVLRQVLMAQFHELHPGLEEIMTRFINAFSAPISLAKNHEIIVRDDASTNLYFIIEGCVYELSERDGGPPRIPQAYTSNDFVFNHHRFTTGRPAETRYIVSRPSTVICLDQLTLEEFHKEAHFDELFFVVCQIMLKNTREHFIHLLHQKPLDHYTWLLAHSPELCSSLTRNHMAAYLGISRATFFRILEKL